MTYTVEVLNQHALNLLRELEQLRLVRLFRACGNGNAANAAATQPSKKKEFKAIRLDTRNFKFNREEANEQ